jgi:tryptophan synthase beta subunit
MDLWATLGISREAGIGAVALGVALAVVVAGRLLRRSRREQRVIVDLSGRG